MAVTPGGVGMGRADGVAMAGLAIDLLPLVAVNGVVADEGDGSIGDEMVEEESRQSTAQFEAGPAGIREDALEAGAVSGRQSAECPQEVGDGASAAGKDGCGGEGEEALGGGQGKERGETVEQGSGFGW